MKGGGEEGKAVREWGVRGRLEEGPVRTLLPLNIPAILSLATSLTESASFSYLAAWITLPHDALQKKREKRCSESVTF
jgi:hypothetical protein